MFKDYQVIFPLVLHWSDDAHKKLILSEEIIISFIDTPTYSLKSDTFNWSPKMRLQAQRGLL